MLNLTTLHLIHTSILRSARERLAKVANRRVAEQAENILDIIEERLSRLQDLNIPEIQLLEQDDGSLLLEWILKDGRIGFNLESDSVESGWYIISKRKDPEIQEWGFLNTLDIERIMNYIS